MVFINYLLAKYENIFFSYFYKLVYFKKLPSKEIEFFNFFCELSRRVTLYLKLNVKTGLYNKLSKLGIS